MRAGIRQKKGKATGSELLQLLDRQPDVTTKYKVVLAFFMGGIEMGSKTADFLRKTGLDFVELMFRVKEFAVSEEDRERMETSVLWYCQDTRGKTWG